MDNLMNVMEAVTLEIEIKSIDVKIEETIKDLRRYLACVDIVYAGDTLRDMGLINGLNEWMTKIYILTTELKDIEYKAVKIQDMEIYFKCEQRICNLIQDMEYISNKYML